MDIFIQFNLFNNGYRLNCKYISLYLLVFLMRSFWRFTDYRSASFSLLQHWKLIDFHTFLLFLSNIVKILLIVRFSLESLVFFYVYNHNSSSNSFAFSWSIFIYIHFGSNLRLNLRLNCNIWVLSFSTVVINIVNQCKTPVK